VHRIRAILLRHRTALINQMRGLLGERGLAISRSPCVPEMPRTSADESKPGGKCQLRPTVGGTLCTDT
jgi:hypothetical protein